MKKISTLLLFSLFASVGIQAQSVETWAVTTVNADTTIATVNGDFSASDFVVNNPMVTFMGKSSPLPDFPYNVTKQADNKAKDANWAKKNARTGTITYDYVDSVGIKDVAYWSVYDVKAAQNQVIPNTMFFNRIEGNGNPYVKAPVVASKNVTYNGFHLYGHGGSGYLYAATENPAGWKIPTDNGNPSGAILEGTTDAEKRFVWKDIPTASREFSSAEAAAKYGTDDQVLLKDDPAYSEFIFSPTSKQLPVQGCYYEFTPKYNGTMGLVIRLTKGEQVAAATHQAEILDENEQPTGEYKTVVDSYNYIHRPFFVLDKTANTLLSPDKFTFVGYLNNNASNALTESDTEESYVDEVYNAKTIEDDPATEDIDESKDAPYLYPRKALPYTFTMNDDYTFQPGGEAEVGSAKAARYSKYFQPLIGTVSFPVEANKTYIVLTPASQIGLYGYEFSTGDPASVNVVEVKESKDAPRYNTAGQRVDENYRGLIIQNGKKILK